MNKKLEQLTVTVNLQEKQLTETVNLQEKQIKIMEKQMTEMNTVIESQRKDQIRKEWNMKVLHKTVKSQSKILTYIKQEQQEQYETIRKLEAQAVTCSKELSKKDLNEVDTDTFLEGRKLLFPLGPGVEEGFKTKKMISSGLQRKDSNIKRNSKAENRKGGYMTVNSNLSQAGKSEPKTMKRAAPSALPMSRAGIAFSTYLSHNYDHLSIGHIIKLDQVTLNDGNGYNKHTGVFTVPQSGVYLLTYTFEGYHLSHPVEVELLVDDINYGSAVAVGTSSTNDMSGKTVILHLIAGQSVWLQTYYYADASIYTNRDNRFTAFAGVFLY